MSNRLIQIGRVPLIPDPYVALKASEAFSLSRAQTEQVIALGAAYLRIPSFIRNTIRRCADRLERAIQIRNLSMMNDTSLADIGVRREQLPQLYNASKFDQIVGPRRPIWLSDSER